MSSTFFQVAEPQFLFGTIRDWFGKHSDDLDTAASNLNFYVQEHHKHTGGHRTCACTTLIYIFQKKNYIHILGLKVECTASIGPAYWHASQETCTVTEQKPDYTSWISGTGEGWVDKQLFSISSPCSSGTSMFFFTFWKD